jgi:threonine synthase
MWRFAEALPVDAAAAVSLGEGGTPLVELSALAREWNVAALFAKNESANPTWSHKDRLVSASITAARQLGVGVVTAASTGNHGASVAAYAARAGLRSVIVTRTTVPPTMKALMQSFGAFVVAVDSSAGRYEILTECVDRFGWYSLSNSIAPPVGSSPYGIDGYKTIAYELWQQLDGRLPEWLVVPVAYGDCLAGVARGLVDLVTLGLAERAPRLVAAERFGALARAREIGLFDAVPVEPTEAFSIGGAYTTAQAVDALDATDGVACTVDEPALLAAQERLARREGLLAEAASCVALAAVGQLRESGLIAARDSVVVLLTSSGLKAPESLGRRLPDVPEIEPRLDELQRAARERLGDGDTYAELFTEGHAA